MSTAQNSEIGEVTAHGDIVEEITAHGNTVYRRALIIDDWSDGDRDGWTVPGSTGSDRVITPGLQGYSHKWRLENFREGHLRGVDAVDRGPQPGDVFGFWANIVDTSGDVINRFEFAADGTDDPSMYRLEYERFTGDEELSLEKYTGGNQDLLGVDESFSPTIGQTYWYQINWNLDGSNNVSSEVYLPNGSLVASCGFQDNSSGDHAQPGVYFQNSGNAITDQSGLTITDPV